MPRFFVPSTASDELEANYAALARMAGCISVPSYAERIHSIIFTLNGSAWEAQVGERLRGRQTRLLRYRGQWVDDEYDVTDTAIVLAIFPGSPYVVVTDGGSAQGGQSRWANLIYAGRPVNVVLFSGQPPSQHAACSHLARSSSPVLGPPAFQLGD
jgi:hypothetical protein